MELLNALGRPVRHSPATSAEVCLAVAGLPAGLYLVRVTYAEGTVVRRVVIE